MGAAGPDVREELASDGAMSVNKAVEFTGISRAELYRQMAGGKLAYIKHGTRRIIPRRALIALLTKGLAVPAGADVPA